MEISFRLCKFNAFFGEALQDNYRFICGVKSESLWRRLLLEDDLTLAKATEISVVMEVSDKDSKTVEAKLNESACECILKVHYTKQENQWKNNKINNSSMLYL